MLSIILSRSVPFIASPQRNSGGSAARSRLKRAALVLRMLRRPVIDPKLRPNAAPINTCGLPVDQILQSRLSSSGVHFLLLFFGMGAQEKGLAITTSCQRDRFLFSHLCRWADCETSPPVRSSVDYGPDMHLCLMLALGITYAQHGAANQYAPPPEICRGS